MTGLVVAQDTTIPDSIDELGSRFYATRATAHERLIKHGNAAIPELVQAAQRADRQIAVSCVEILVAIAKSGDKDAATTALDSIAGNDESKVAGFAKKRAFQLRETKRERAIRKLSEAGIRVYYSPTNEVRSISGVPSDTLCAQLPHIKELRMVSLFGEGVTGRSLDYLEKMDGLQYLSISRHSIDPADVEKISRLVNLSNITMSGDIATVKGIRTLKRLPKLQSLSVIQPIDGDVLSEICELNIRSAYLSHVNLSPTSLDRLASCNLDSLNVTLKGVRPGELDWVTTCSVRSLSISLEDSPELTNQDLKSLIGDSLMALDLEGLKIDNDGLKHLVKCPKLRSLEIRDTPVTIDGLRHLSGATRLSMLSLRGTKVSNDELVDWAKKMPALRYLRNNNDDLREQIKQ